MAFVQSLSNSDMNINLGVLETAHSNFCEWRSLHTRAQTAFWSIIKFVHSKFLVLYFQLLEMTMTLILATSDPLHAQTTAVLIDIYYDLICQDLAPEFEDRHETFFA